MKDEKKTLKKPERGITTSEEAAEITRQRREKYGLGESGNLTPEKTKEIKADIKKLKDLLDEYDFSKCRFGIKEEWYLVEQEVNAGKDRELARAVLKEFLGFLEKSNAPRRVESS